MVSQSCRALEITFTALFWEVVRPITRKQLASLSYSLMTFMFLKTIHSCSYIIVASDVTRLLVDSFGDLIINTLSVPAGRIDISKEDRFAGCKMGLGLNNDVVKWE
jgi:hypothetical protein